MTIEEFEIVLRAMNRRKPFRPYMIEFVSGARILVVHPETIGRTEDLFTFKAPDRRINVFTADGVCQFLDPPK